MVHNFHIFDFYCENCANEKTNKHCVCGAHVIVLWEVRQGILQCVVEI